MLLEWEGLVELMSAQLHRSGCMSGKLRAECCLDS